MLAYRMSASQAATWLRGGEAQIGITTAITEIVQGMTTEGVLVVDYKGFPVFFVAAQPGGDQ
jgi:hypothetical protein